MWKYKIGSVIRENDIISAGRVPRWGHVIGFSRVEYDDGYAVILKVRWDDGTETRISPGNVLLEDELKNG